MCTENRRKKEETKIEKKRKKEGKGPKYKFYPVQGPKPSVKEELGIAKKESDQKHARPIESGVTYRGR